VSLLRAGAPQVPIIVAGDSSDKAVALEAVRAGAHDYLVKNQLNSGWLERSLRYAIERHRMDRALLAAEEKYHSVFDHLVEGIFQTTPDGHYVMANAALARIYGYGSPEDLMQNLVDIGQRLYVQEGRRAEFVRLMQENDTTSGFESQVYRKDGSIIWISENCRAVRDVKGRLLYYEGTVEDITQRRQAEENLRNSEALYHSLVETLPQNIFRKDLQGRFTFANKQFCKMLARSPEEKIRRVNALLAQSRKELQARNSQMEDDLKMAREIQLTMLPQQYPAFPDPAAPGGSLFQFTHRYLPSGTVGGDFFTVSALSH